MRPPRSLSPKRLGAVAIAAIAAAGVVAPAATAAKAKKTATTTAQVASVDTRPFASTSFWNTPLASNAPLDAKSGTYVGDIKTMLTTVLPWINTTSSSEPVYRVGASQPLVNVTLDKTTTDSQTTALRAAFQGVPVPGNAIPAAGADHNLVVYQASTDTMWEFWEMTKQADGWHAKWGGKMSSVSTNPGYYTDPNNRWGASATSLPILGGLMTLDELAAGHIDHALAVSLPQIRASYYSWPAQRTDGTVNDANAIPEGTRFRLPANLNLNAIPMSPIVREMAVAVQKYGMVVRDVSGSVAFYGEDPTQTGTNPYGGLTGYFLGKYPSTLLASFPWAKLQALQTQLAYDPY